MPIQNNKQIPHKSNNRRLLEVGKILANAIIRLEKKKNQEISEKRLDSNFCPSVYAVTNNLNQGG